MSPEPPKRDAIAMGGAIALPDPPAHSDVVWVVDAEGRIVSASEAALSFLGHDWDTVQAAGPAQVAGWLAGRPFDAVPMAGGWQVCRPRAAPRATGESGRAVRPLLLFCPFPIAVHREGRILMVNPALAELLGYARTEDLYDRPLGDLFCARSPETAGTPDRCMVGAGGALFPVELYSVGATFEGHPAVVSFVRDLSALRQAERQLHEMSAILTLGRVVANVAHEVTNPLTYVVNNVEMVRETLQQAQGNCEESVDMLPTESVDGLLRAITETGDGVIRIRALIEDLRNITRPQQRDQLSSVELTPVLESAIRIAVANNRQKFDLRRDYRATRPVVGNVNRLSQVFLNLLVNAVQAIDTGLTSGNSVTVSTRDVDDGVEVMIADTGCGMPDEVVERAFEPFFTTKREGVGTGLGLAISQRLVEQCGGEMSLVSELDEGTTCRVWLRSGERVGRRARILLIDPDRRTVESVRQTLAQHVIVASSSMTDALARLASREAFDLVLCDMGLHRRTGVEIFSALNQTGHGARLALTTAGVVSPAMAEFLRQHDVPWLTKPLTAEAVGGLLEGVLAAPRTSERQPASR